MKKINLALIFGCLVIVCTSQTIIIRNTGCNSYDQNDVCKSCSTRFYKDQRNICQPVNSNCKTYDQVKGDCLSCYPGFGLIQDTCLPGFEYLEQSFDQNCNQYKQNICVKCSLGYYFNANSICTKADSNCHTFDQMSGDCLTCYPGFILSEGKCNTEAPKVIDANCNQFGTNGACAKCSSGYFFGSGLCTKIDDSCKNFDIQKAVCTTCYPGYFLNVLSQCVKEQIQQNSNPFCVEWEDKVCLKCAKNTDFDQDGICIQTDNVYCEKLNTVTGTCIICYAGYTLQNNVCTLTVVEQVTDLHCNSFSQSGVCIKCSVGYYFNENEICTKIDDSCKSFSIVNKKCMQCYRGYQLDSLGQCLKTQQKVSDSNCAEWSNNLCTKCSVGAVLDIYGKCVVRDSQCKEFDNSNQCKACYAGYKLNQNNACELQGIQQVTDPLCAEWNLDLCIRCSHGSFISASGLCSMIDTQCKTANELTGECLSCYDGYQLTVSGSCVKAIQSVSDVNCAEWSDKICLKCSLGAAFDNLGKCIILDSQCKEYDQVSGVCKACYSGYELNQLLICHQSVIQSLTDAFCSQWKDSTCVKCSPGSLFGENGKCTQTDPSCKGVDSLTGACLGCYDGYQLSAQKTCIKAVEQVSDVNCAQWNGKVCSKCGVGSTFNSLGKCVFLDVQCKQYDSSNELCRACYTGYSLDSSSNCVIQQNQQVRDVFCGEWNGEVCLKCSNGSIFNSQGICSQIDSECKTFNQLTGQCQSCYPGYQLSLSKKCLELSIQGQNDNSLCAQWIEKVCMKCSTGSFLNGLGKCQTVDPTCKTSSVMTGECTSCFEGYEISGSKCVVSLQQVRDPLCKQFNGLTCVKCSFGAFFNSQGTCQLTDSLCQKFNQQSGQCLACYPGHVLFGQKCQVDKTQAIKDSFCAQIDGQLCIKCSEGYYFQIDGKCTAAHPLCASFNAMNGECLTCFTGYQLEGGLCIFAKEQVKDPNCVSFQDGICLQCPKGFIFNQLGQCQLTNPLCKSFDAVTGACTTCYIGYVVSGNTCVVDSNSPSSNCADYSDQICILCASMNFMNLDGQCEKVSEECRTYNDINGHCLSCYLGFALESGKCARNEAQGGCSQFDKLEKCIKCASGFYVGKGQCTQIDTQCAKFNSETQKCQGCYNGYTLSQQRCQISTVSQEYQVKNCFTYNIQNKCMQCFDRFYLSNNQCKDVNVFCKTYDLVTGSCTGCYSTFKLNNGQCTK